MTKNQERLAQLEKTGEYVFHGSGEEIETFEPRQAYNYINGAQEPDGVPAVFASSLADYAVFMALINTKNCPQGLYSSAGLSRDGGDTYLRLRLSEKTAEQLTENSSGWVYVFKKDQFTLRDEGGIEYLTTTSVAPYERMQVTYADMPQTVEIFKEME